MTASGGDGRSSLRRRPVGDLDRVGWWILPAFLAVGLAGAVMAGSLAVVYYSRQVSALEAETREARQDLRAGVDDVEAAREDALAAIDERLDAVQDLVDDEPPVEDLTSLGLVMVEARVNSPAPPSATVEPQPPPGGDGEAAGAPAVVAQDQPADPEPTTPPDPPDPEPSPDRAPVRPRLGVGFRPPGHAGRPRSRPR